MFYTLQREAVVTHAVSQLCHVWLPTPEPDIRGESFHREDLSEISLREWHLYIEEQMQGNPASHWGSMARRKLLGALTIAKIIFDNLREIGQANAHFIDFFHPCYPYLLKHILDPPSGLVCLGDIGLLLSPKIAIVGSRKASSFAFQEARELACLLARKGTVIVSGGAFGCDSAAHLGALDSELRPVPTIVVFAGGLCRLHPQSLQNLFIRLQMGSALFVSERLWHSPARPIDFPIRNRIIAGLSMELVLMQAAQKSGALKTATYALEQGREVYALLHDKDDIRAGGSHALIEDGARPIVSAADFISFKQVF